MNRKILIILLLILPVEAVAQNPDIRILRAIYSPETLPSDRFFRFVSNSNTYFITGVPAGMMIAGVAKNDKELIDNAIASIGAAVVNLGITAALKYTVNRARPFEKYPDIIKKTNAGSPSFPSGHTSGAFAAATSISLVYPKWYVIAPSFAYAGLVAYSRMDLGVHYPSDVVAGAVIGAGCAFLTFKISEILLKKQGKGL
ncbi:MAG: phosphatase PAP2 family protein [Bacteroidota bacterium]|nr:phosphatase PAP2 family protein [Bacteroidota bacterium]